MADYKVTDTQLTNIANAIRTKGGTSEQLEFPTEFIEAVGDITAVTQADEGKVVSNGALVAQTSTTVTQNGTVDTTLNDEVVVNVSGGSGAVKREIVISVNGGIGGGAVITVSIGGSVVFTATATDTANLVYDNTSAVVTVEGYKVSITVVPPTSNTGILYIYIFAENAIACKIPVGGTYTSEGYVYSRTDTIVLNGCDDLGRILSQDNLENIMASEYSSLPVYAITAFQSSEYVGNLKNNTKTAFESYMRVTRSTNKLIVFPRKIPASASKLYVVMSAEGIGSYPYQYYYIITGTPRITGYNEGNIVGTVAKKFVITDNNKTLEEINSQEGIVYTATSNISAARQVVEIDLTDVNEECYFGIQATYSYISLYAIQIDGVKPSLDKIVDRPWPSWVTQSVKDWINEYGSGHFTMDGNTALSSEWRYDRSDSVQSVVYNNTAMQNKYGLVLLADTSQTSASSVTLADSIENYSAIILQGIYNKNRESNYDTNMLYCPISTSKQYWAGMKDRNSSYECKVTFTDNTHASLTGNKQVLIYGMP